VSTEKDGVTQTIYADPRNPALADPGFKLDVQKAALVVIDPQNDFLSPAGASWFAFGESIVANDTVRHLDQLFAAAKGAGIAVVVSLHYYYPTDHAWNFGGPLEKVMHDISMFDRKGALTLEGFEGSGADSLSNSSRIFSMERRLLHRLTRFTARKPMILSCNFGREACHR